MTRLTETTTRRKKRRKELARAIKAGVINTDQIESETIQGEYIRAGCGVSINDINISIDDGSKPTPFVTGEHNLGYGARTYYPDSNFEVRSKRIKDTPFGDGSTIRPLPRPQRHKPEKTPGVMELAMATFRDIEKYAKRIPNMEQKLWVAVVIIIVLVIFRNITGGY